MSIRTAPLAGSALVLALVLIASAEAKRPPAPGDKEAPTTPTNLHITASSDTSISLAWNASTDNSTNWWYCVQANGASCIRVDPPQTTYTRSNLVPGSTTTFTVYAIDASGNRSGTSNAVTYTVPPDTTPPSPAPTLAATTVTSTWLSFSWTASQDSGSEVLYTVYLDGMPRLINLPWRFTNVFGLMPSSTHELQVDARDNFGNVAQSNLLSVTTPAATNRVPPTAPTNVQLGFQSGNGEAWLSWDRSTDDADPQDLIVYEIYFNGLPNYPESVIGGNSTIAYCTVQGIGLTEVVLRAVDTSGNRSDPSNAVWVDC
jgi:chitodextrinase